jgi:serine/threonine protein phosphatase PrpC
VSSSRPNSAGRKLTSKYPPLSGADIGDSRLIIGRKVDDTRQSDGSPALVSEQVSEDHKPDGEGEKQRILQAGGRVFAVEYDDGMDGPQRVWLGHMDVPGLAMSRSVGDKVAHTAGVISTPEWFERQLVPEVRG